MKVGKDKIGHFFMGVIVCVSLATLLLIARWLVISLVLFVLTCGLAGCGQGVRMPDHGSSFFHAGSPGEVLSKLALFFTALAGIGLIGCTVAAFFATNKWEVLKAAIFCFAAIIGCQILYWLGEHLALAVGLSLVAFSVFGGLYLFAHRKSIEIKTGIDFNQDGKIG